MYILDLILFLAVIFSIASAITLKLLDKGNKYSSMLYILPTVLCIMHFIMSKFNYLAVPIYIASLIILLMNIARKKKIIYRIMCSLTILLLAIPIGITVSFEVKNYASTSYENAFKNLNKQLKENYPFTEWKKIDFDKKHDEYIERFRSADKNKDKEEYYLALKDYLISFNDGHIYTYKPEQLLFGVNDELVSSLSQKYTGYGYGFSLIKLDDDNVVVSMIDENSNAFKAGIRVGTIITKWNDKPIKDVVNEGSKTWSLSRSTDKDNMEQNNYMMLSRTREGESTNITFRDESNKEQALNLKAQENNYNIGTKDRDIFYHKENDNKDVECKLLNEVHGYIKISTMQPENQEEVLVQFKNALNEFKEKNAKDLIIDVRNNGGGDDEFAAKIMGLLSNKEFFYLQENLYDSKTKSFVKKKDILCKVNYVGFDKPIVVIINSISASATEGFAYNIKKLDNAVCAGITGTNGSFGTIDGGEILMPENYIVFYPEIACLDEKDNIMIDSDYTGVGGVKPDLKIPLNMNAIDKLYVQGNDYELDYVINYLN